jgi:putative transposase
VYRAIQSNSYIHYSNNYIYTDIEELQDRATSWLWTDNNERPNIEISDITPIQKRRLTKSMNSVPELH